MNPTRQEFDELKRRVDAIHAVQDVPFIENIKRRGAQGLIAGDPSSAGSISVAAGDPTNTGSVAVATSPDVKLQIFLPNGSVYYLGAYNS